jgi:hypothetical protein
MRPDLYDHELPGDHKNDLQEGAQRLQELMKQVPDLTVDVRDVIADGDKVVTSSNIVDETTAVKSSATLATAENAAADALKGSGVAFFNYKGNEYFIATNNTETAVSSNDAIVKLVGVIDLTATDSGGHVTL